MRKVYSYPKADSGINTSQCKVGYSCYSYKYPTSLQSFCALCTINIQWQGVPLVNYAFNDAKLVVLTRLLTANSAGYFRYLAVLNVLTCNFSGSFLFLRKTNKSTQ